MSVFVGKCTLLEWLKHFDFLAQTRNKGPRHLKNSSLFLLRVFHISRIWGRASTHSNLLALPLTKKTRHQTRYRCRRRMCRYRRRICRHRIIWRCRRSRYRRVCALIFESIFSLVFRWRNQPLLRHHRQCRPVMCLALKTRYSSLPSLGVGLESFSWNIW